MSRIVNNQVAIPTTCLVPTAAIVRGHNHQFLIPFNIVQLSGVLSNWCVVHTNPLCTSGDKNHMYIIKHKVNEHLSEWIWTGLLESIKPTKHKVNEHLSGGEWIRTGSFNNPVRIHSPPLRCSLTLCLVGLILSNNPVRIHSLRCSLTLCLVGLILLNESGLGC
jgi:hypothetical protein